MRSSGVAGRHRINLPLCHGFCPTIHLAVCCASLLHGGCNHSPVSDFVCHGKSESTVHLSRNTSSSRDGDTRTAVDPDCNSKSIQWLFKNGDCRTCYVNSAQELAIIQHPPLVPWTRQSLLSLMT